ncbi:unnamed protein product [Orchesella dallaii]|uniref:Uncharacterized protein n=1 Tax=Orchesella dallaii TaxID=48710 RepID=A0ABP1QMY1_9HEXA
MYKISLICAILVLLVSEGYGVPQGRRVRQEQQQVHQEQHMDPVKIEQEMTHEHAKLIENLQRLKRTLQHVKEKVGNGSVGTAKASDVRTPETAILTVLKSLQEQGQLFAMINDMIKAGSEVQNQTAKIQHYAELEEQARAEASAIESTNQIVSGPVTAAAPSSKSNRLSSRRDNEIHMKMKDDPMNPAKQHGYDDYQYQYRDDGDSTGDDQYDYHYDAGGYDEAPSSARGKARTTTTTTTTTRKPNRRVRTRGRQEYY